MVNRVRYSVCSLLLALSLFVSILPGNANAASDYDDLLHVSPTLYVYTDGSAKTQKMDISATWWDDGV
ncbi:MAG TPA: hypothetical protein VFT59_03795 [Candidatus Saccharimonadales bacterium]|nr:hypothetical protein [Candidatus Saccharimonadales bacterium]